MADAISNSEDILDSRDVIERMDELADFQTAVTDAQEELTELQEEFDSLDPEDEYEAERRVDVGVLVREAERVLERAQFLFDDDAQEELRILSALNDEGKDYSGDWGYGATLIRDSYFIEYAKELADDIGAIDSNASWPCDCIDWEKAADQLKMDYASIDFDGVEYWVRS
jgi:galactokinase